MNKSAEIAHLRHLISVLGPDSYIGPWLSQVLSSVEQDIRSDLYPTITLADSEKQCADLLAEANRQASDIVARAQTTAGQIRNRADNAMEYAASNLRSALTTLLN